MLKKTVTILFFLSEFMFVQGQRIEEKQTNTSHPVGSITTEDIKKLPNFSFDGMVTYSLGEAAKNYALGFSTRIIYTNNPYGFIKESEKPAGVNDLPVSAVEKSDILSKRIGWLAGLDYTLLPGKKEHIGPITYKFDNLSILHALLGINYDPCPRGDVELGAGPAIGFFGGGSSDFGYGVSLSGHYAFKPSPVLLDMIKKHRPKRLALGIEGGINYYHFGDDDPIYTIRTGIRISF